VEAPFCRETLSLNWFGLIKIDNIPFLVCSLMNAPNNDLSSFFILSSVDIKCFLVLQVDEVSILLTGVLEELEPSRVGAPDLHVVGSSCTLDIPRLVVKFCSDCQGLLVEVPDLSVSAVWCLDDKVPVVDEV